MAVTRERFAQGMTYEEYKAQMTRNRERFDENEAGLSLDPEDVEAFRRAGRVHVLVITEDWCGDAIANFPLLGRIAREAGTLDIRVFLRDENEDLISRYLNNGHRSIPVFVVFDEDFRELGHWIERPASVTAERTARRQKIFASDPRFGSPDEPVDRLPEDVRTELQGRLQAMRDDMKAWSDAEVVRELRELVSKAA